MNDFYRHFALIFWAVLGPVVQWHALGKVGYVQTLSPRAQKWLGVKLFKGKNEKTYMEGPLIIRRLQFSLLFGLAYAAFLAWLYTKIVPLIF